MKCYKRGFHKFNYETRKARLMKKEKKFMKELNRKMIIGKIRKEEESRKLRGRGKSRIGKFWKRKINLIRTRCHRK